MAPTAGGDEAAEAPTRLERVALFKNGLGFFVAESKLPDAAGPLLMGPYPAAAHGTFWVAYPSAVKLEGLVAKKTFTRTSVDALSIPTLLQANVGKKARVYLSQDEVIEGTIAHFPQVPQPTEAESRGRVAMPWPPTGGQGQLALIETAEGTTAIAPHAARRVDFPDKDVTRSFDTKTEAVQLQAHLEKPAPDRVLTATYLAKGITWAPSYMVDVSDPEKARLSAKATIINEAADLDYVQVALITGFPNLRFADVLSPLALKENLAGFLQSLGRGESRPEGAPAVVTQNVFYGGAVGGFGGGGMAARAPSEAPDYRAAAAGQTAEDLFLYPLENVRLEKGEVGYYPLFTESVPYKHIYQWEIPDYLTEEDRYRQRGGEQRERPEEVWHSLRLENTSKVPWTTAPAETVQNAQILGQDILHYTPPGGETTLRITQAVSVKAEQIELETARKRNATRFYATSYDLVSVEGKLSIRNFQEKSITLEITKRVSGEVKSSAPKADIEKVARGLRGVNTSNVLTWTLELEPDQTEEIIYAYDVYVRT
jgi:hypothetical protein